MAICTITGTLKRPDGTPASLAKLLILRAVKPNQVITLDIRSFEAEANGTIELTAEQGSTIYIQANAYGGAVALNVEGGIPISVPEEDEAILEDLISAASVPTAGLTIKNENVSLPTLIGVVDFIGAGVSATQASPGAARIEVTGETPWTPKPDAGDIGNYLKATADGVAEWSADGISRYQDLTDVDFATFADGDIPQWNSVSGKQEGRSVSEILGTQDALIFKGVIDCSASPNYPAADAGHVYKISVAGKIGGASGANVEAGDTLYCIADGSSAGTQAAVGASWVIVQANIDGAVVGPTSAVSGNLASFNGTTGKIIQDGTVAIDTDGTLAANSDQRVGTQKAFKTYVDGRYLFSNVPVSIKGTLVSVIAANLSSGDNDLYTCPSGKRALIFIVSPFNTAGTTTAIFLEQKISGTYYRVGGNTNVSTVSQAIVSQQLIALEAGESVALNCNQAGINVAIRVFEVDADVPITMRRLNSMTLGDNTLYTVSPGKQGIILPQAVTGVSNSGSGNVAIVNSSGGPITYNAYIVPNGGSQILFRRNTNQANNVVDGGPQCPFLNAGDAVVINSNSGNAGQSAFLIVYEI